MCLLQTGTSGDANATADSAFFLIAPLYKENPNPIVPYKSPNSLIRMSSPCNLHSCTSKRIVDGHVPGVMYSVQYKLSIPLLST